MKVFLTLLATASLILANGQRAEAQAQPSPAPAAAPAQSQQLLSTAQLDQLLAPVALYPDALLADIMMASTYPLEVVQADRWAKDHQSLKGDALGTALQAQSWDKSVKSLVITPDVLTMMSTKLDWTQKLGDAVLAQQTDVMDSVQRLRAKAQANNKLQTTKQQKVTVNSVPAANNTTKQVIAIEPAEPNTVYVPYYDPGVVYGAWPYAAYPPYYWGYPGWIPGSAIAAGIAWGAGIAFGAWAINNWGGGFNWGNNNININRNTNVNIDRGNNNFVHRPEHRHGVRYNNRDVQQKFGNRGDRGNVQNRMDFRGRDGRQVLNPDRPGAGDRMSNRGDRDRPGAGGRDRPGVDRDRPGAGGRDRPGGDRDRPGAGGRDRPGSDRVGSRDRPGADRAGTRDRPGAGDRGRGGGSRDVARRGGGRDSAFGGVGGGGGAARAQAMRGHASLGGGGGGARFAGGGGGGFRGGGGGGGFRGGGGGGFRGGGGGRRSDVELKHDISLLGRLDNGLGFYRFVYNGGQRAYVGVMAQEVEAVMPGAVVRGQDGYLRVLYGRIGVKFESYDRWLSSGARIPSAAVGGNVK
jgi:hypothetical protein